MYTKEDPINPALKIIDTKKPMDYLHLLFIVRIPLQTGQNNEYPFIIVEITESALKNSKFDQSSKTITFGKGIELLSEN
jgi:hypothetical protein